MKLPKEIADTIPPLYSKEYEKNQIAVVKFFAPSINWEWYVIEGDLDNGLFFGVVKGFETELGYFTIDEAEHIMGFNIERDILFEPTPIKELLK